MPGQFKNLAPYLASNPGNCVVFITQRGDIELPGVRRVVYRPARAPRDGQHPYLGLTEAAVLNGQEVLRRCLALQGEGFRPDIVIAHPGWGESLYIKDVFPRAALLSYCEYFYRGRGLDIGFDPEQELNLDILLRARTRSAHLLLALEACDRGISPTHWQRAVHPAAYQSKISVVFDGVDTEYFQPNPVAEFSLPNGRRLTRADRVVTYTARNLEPYRGFPTFARSIRRILKCEPDAVVVIVGGDAVSYGSPPESGGTWRQAVERENGPFDAQRVVFLPRLSYGEYRTLLQVSAAHVYLTYPFVLSWSFIEALACGCALVASRTGPVEEVVTDGHTALLVDFFDSAALAEAIIATLRCVGDSDRRRERARRLALEQYELRKCLHMQTAILNTMI